MARDTLIRWKKGDYIKLGRAVSDFNKKVKRLEAEQGKLGLPELVNYQDIKADILTRREFNRQLNLLKSFKEEGIENLVVVNDEVMTEWERQNITKERQRILRNLNKDIKAMETKQFGMGSNELKALQARKEAVISFDRKLITKLAKTDFSMKKAIQYRENVIEQFNDLPPEFDKIKNYLLSKTNPIDFFDEMQKSRVLQNYFDWYRDPSAFGSFDSDEDIASFIEDELEI